MMDNSGWVKAYVAVHGEPPRRSIEVETGPSNEQLDGTCHGGPGQLHDSIEDISDLNQHHVGRRIAYLVPGNRLSEASARAATSLSSPRSRTLVLAVLPLAQSESTPRGSGQRDKEHNSCRGIWRGAGKVDLRNAPASFWYCRRAIIPSRPEPRQCLCPAPFRSSPRLPWGWPY